MGTPSFARHRTCSPSACDFVLATPHCRLYTPGMARPTKHAVTRSARKTREPTLLDNQLMVPSPIYVLWIMRSGERQYMATANRVKARIVAAAKTYADRGSKVLITKRTEQEITP